MRMTYEGNYILNVYVGNTLIKTSICEIIFASSFHVILCDFYDINHVFIVQWMSLALAEIKLYIMK